MRSILERLLIIVTPLLAAAPSPKKATKTRTVRGAAKTKKPSARGKVGRPPARGKAKAPGRTPRGRGKAESPAPKAQAAKTKSAPPGPKPPPPIGRAILLTPENGKYADSVFPKFRWLSVGGANRYDVVWSEEPNFAGAHSTTSVATEAAVPAEHPLRVGAQYYWRVRGGNEGGWGPWSLAYSFQVLETPPAA